MDEKNETLERVLAETLHRFSMDLVKMVHAYVVWPNAKALTQPTTLFSIQSTDELKLNTCQGMAYSPKNEIWVARTGGVVAYDMDGRLLRYVTALSYVAYYFGIAFASNGNGYITDYKNNSVSLYQPDGTVLWLKENLGEGTTFVAVDSKHNVMFISDSVNYCVTLFTLDGRFLEDWKRVSPRGITINSKNEIGVVDINYQCISVFDRNGKSLQKIQVKIPENDHINCCPFALAVDKMDNWFVSDYANSLVLVFQRNGDFMTSFFVKFARGLCIDAENRIWIGSQSTVEVLGYLH